MRTIFRHEIPIDDQPHPIEVNGEISPTVNVKYYGPGYVVMEVWAEHVGKINKEVQLQVYGTGHEIPGNAVYRATAPRDKYGLVFHLYEVSVG